MKRRLLPLLALLCALFVLPCAAHAADGSWGSDYETERYFRIYTADDLFAFAEMVNNGYDFEGKFVSLENTIDISGREWIPIGFSREHPFRGDFDGRNHVIEGLTYTGNSGFEHGYYDVGLFGNIDGTCSIQNLFLDSVSIVFDKTSNQKGILQTVGGIVAHVNGFEEIIINDCTINGYISVKGNLHVYVGGIVGFSKGAVEYTQLTNNATIETSMSSGWIGGIIGDFRGELTVIKNCINNGDIYSDNLQTVGGIVGNGGSYTSNLLEKKSRIENCTNSGNITAVGYCGGIIGKADKLSVENCSNHGNIRSIHNTLGQSGSGFGGIIGSYSGYEVYSDHVVRFRNCINYGDVDAPDADMVGGIVGNSSEGPYIEQCSNHGDINGYSMIGGICGKITGISALTTGDNVDYRYRIYSCENTGSVSGSDSIGGIVGSASCVESGRPIMAFIEENTNRGQISGANRVGGIVGETSGIGGSFIRWPIIRENKNLGWNTNGGAIIGYNVEDYPIDDEYKYEAIYHNYWTNSISLPLIGDGDDDWEKRIWGNGAYNVATGLLDEPYTDPYGNRIISIDGQIAPPEEPEKPEEPEQPQDPEQITIRFDAGGFAENPSDIITSPGASIFLPSLADTGDQRFLGWTVNGLDYWAGDTVAVYEDMVFTARWEAIGEDPGADMVQEVWMTIGSSLFTADGEERSMDTAPFISNSRTYVPIRALGEAFGAQVEWDGIGRTVTITLDGSTIVMYMGSVTYFVNGDVMEMDVEPVIVNSRTCVPVRFVTEAVGFRVTPHYSPFDHTTEAVQFNRY